MKVAFLGLGHMGLPMALNLQNAGHDVQGFDVMPLAREAAASAGLRIGDSGEALAVDADVVLTMFPSGRHLIEAYQNGLLAAAPEGAMFLDCSTINVSEAKDAAVRALAAGHRAVDAPVSGGVVGAENATLTFMVGAADADFETVEPLLAAMGKKVVHCGGNGAGQAAKICNNMLLGISMIGAAEAFVLGEQLGLEHQALFDVISTASGQCWSVTTNCPVPGPVPSSPANRDYQPGFAGALMKKDLGLAVNALAEQHVAAHLGPAAAELYAQFCEDGGSGMDFSAIITKIRRESGRDNHVSSTETTA